MKRLNIFVDETGGFGFGEGTSRLYGISFVFHEQDNDIRKEIDTLNDRLNKLEYHNMIHTAALIINKGEYKSASSRLIKNEFPNIREKLWKEAFWSKSFCLVTTGGVTIDIIRKYIESQGGNNEEEHSIKSKNIS